MAMIIDTQKELREPVKVSDNEKNKIITNFNLLNKAFCSIRENKIPDEKLLSKLKLSSQGLLDGTKTFALRARTNDSRQVSDYALKISNQLQSFFEIVLTNDEYEEYTPEFVKKFRFKLRESIETLETLINVYLKFDVHLNIDDSSNEELKDTKKSHGGKRVKNLSELQTLLKIEVEKKEKTEEQKPIPSLDLTDEETLILSKYKNFVKRLSFDDEEGLGLSFINSMPVLMVTRGLMSRERLAIEGVTVEKLGNYTVLPNQLIVGMEIPPNYTSDKTTIQKDAGTINYILKCAANKYNGTRFDCISTPKVHKGMICYWLIESKTMSTIRRVHKTFFLNTWSFPFKV